jgi:hypothetical protein
MDEPANTVIDRVKVREVAGVFRSRSLLDAAVNSLLLAGFDRADIDLMAGADTVRRTLGTVYAPPEELADASGVPRRAFMAREDATEVMAGIAVMLTYIGATAAAFSVVASGGTLAVAVAAAAAGGATAGGIGALIARSIGLKQARELESQLDAGGIVLWVRVRSPEREEKAQDVLRANGGLAVRVHEIDIEKRLEDLPLASVLMDTWPGDRPLAKS